MFLLLSLIIALAGLLSSVNASSPHMYRCSFCMTSAASAASSAAKRSSFGDVATSFQESCVSAFSKDACEQTFGGSELFQKIPAVVSTVDAGEFCFQNQHCPNPAVWKAAATTSTSTASMDIRVTKAMGGKGYNKVRVSAITNYSVPLDSSSAMQYSSQFKYRWTDKYLLTGVVEVQPGVKTTVQITPDRSVEIYLPREGEGVRGVIIADPCFQSKWIVCAYENKFQMFNHTIELLNAINAHDDVHYWQILGDNFYDQDGIASGTWFNSLSEASKTKIFAAVPGNHDFWVNAAPNLWVPADQQGNGFFQFYANDVISATDSSPYDFSVNPDVNKNAENIPPAGNFFFYNSVGNTGFIGFSGAHSFDQSINYFDEACTWASNEGDKLQSLLLLGHWNYVNDGCDSNSTTPAVFKELLALPSCQPVASKLRYVVGHKHCNMVLEKDVGFMVGANGMEDATCSPSFGIPVVDTTKGQFRLYYFPINEIKVSTQVMTDNFDAIINCIKSNGVSGCYHLAVEWTTASA